MDYIEVLKAIKESEKVYIGTELFLYNIIYIPVSKTEIRDIIVQWPHQNNFKAEIIDNILYIN